MLSSVCQVFLSKTKLFKKPTRLPPNISVPLLFKCKPSLHKYSLVMSSLLTKGKLFLSHSLRKWMKTCLMTRDNFICFFTKIDEIITHFTP